MNPNQFSDPFRPPTPPVETPQPQPQTQFSPQPVTGPVSSAPTVSPTPQSVYPTTPVQPGYPSTPTPPVYGYSQPTASLPKARNVKRQLILLAISLVAVLGIVAGGVIYLNHSKSNLLSGTTNSTNGDANAVVSRSDGTLDLSKLIDVRTALKSEDLQAKMNEQINMSDGISYMVTGVQRNFTSSSPSLQAKAGKELVKINLVIGSRMKSGTAYIDSTFFKLKTSAGGLQAAENVAASDVPDALINESLTPGKQAKVAIIYEVNKDEPISAVVTSNQFKNSSTSGDVTINSTVSLQ